MRSLVVALALAAAAGCAGTGSGGAREPGRDVRGVRAAALPFRILRGRGGSEVAEAELYPQLARARAVCIGEHHPNPHDHWAQLRLLEQLLPRYAAAGLSVGLGMEMFQRPFQGVLDDYAAGKIEVADLLSRTAWKERWGHDFELYRPLIEAARARGAALVALNTPRELTKRVSREGVDRLTPTERAELPELVLDDPDHRAWWASIMGDMGGAEGHASDPHEAPHDPAPQSPPPSGPAEPAAPHGDPALPHGHPPVGEVAAPSPDAAARAERIYTAQVLWDETMADGAARWLAGGATRRLVILAGSGHCHESAIVRRLERRKVGDVVSIRPLIDKGDGELAALLARPENDFLFVMARR